MGTHTNYSRCPSTFVYGNTEDRKRNHQQRMYNKHKCQTNVFRWPLPAANNPWRQASTPKSIECRRKLICNICTLFWNAFLVRYPRERRLFPAPQNDSHPICYRYGSTRSLLTNISITTSCDSVRDQSPEDSSLGFIPFLPLFAVAVACHRPNRLLDRFERSGGRTWCVDCTWKNTKFVRFALHPVPSDFCYQKINSGL